MAGHYEVNVVWGARDDSAPSCAELLRQVLSELIAIDPNFSNWKTVKLGQKRRVLSPNDPAGLLREVEGGRFYNDLGEPWPDLGFNLAVVNSDRLSIHNIGLHARLGCTSTIDSLCNSISLEVGFYEQTAPTVVTLPVFKPALIALAGLCDAGWGRIAPTRTTDFGQTKPNPLRREVWSGWVVYLSAPLAARITPPRSAIVEAVPGGGMLMIATEETFEPDNPEHFRVACDIQAALAPLNALPWPPDLSVARGL